MINAGKELARDLVNGPIADIYPETLADAALELATDQLSVDVWGEDKIRSEGMNGIIAVGQGSVNPPRFIHLHYKPSGEPRKKIAIVGKGVTFDAGGLSLKPSAGMLTMRCDMAGSAAVIGAMKAGKLASRCRGSWYSWCCRKHVCSQFLQIGRHLDHEKWENCRSSQYGCRRTVGSCRLPLLRLGVGC